MERLSTEKLAAYLDGEVTTNEARDIENRLEADGEAKRRYEKLRNIRRSMKSTFDMPQNDGFCESVIRRVARTEGKRARDRLGFRLAAAFAVVVTSLVAWGVFPSRDAVPDASPTGELTPRGAPLDGADLVKTVGLDAFLYRGSRGDDRVRLRENLPVESGDGLSFVLYNRSGQPVFLTLFGADAENKVHWFYPGPTSDNANLESVQIGAAPEVIALPDGVTLDNLPQGTFRIVALFTRRPLKVGAVEKMFRTGGPASLKECDPGAAVQEIRLSVGAGKTENR